jgi:hypothetical protein
MTDISVILPDRARAGTRVYPNSLLTCPNRLSPDLDGATILARKNTANIDLFRQIAPFQRTPIVVPGNIDENRSLPYKPRQLSAMIRFDRGGSIWAGNGLLWACQHRRTYLNIRQVVS